MMIKCYLVSSNYNNNDVQTRGGKFTERKDYIAKVSNREPFTVMVLDEDLNWIPYEMKNCIPLSLNKTFEKRFTINRTFFVKNKKSLNTLFNEEGLFYMNDRYGYQQDMINAMKIN